MEEVGEDLSKLSQHQKLDRLYELGYIKIRLMVRLGRFMSITSGLQTGNLDQIYRSTDRILREP